MSSLQEIHIGKVINLLANDLNELDFGFLFLWPKIVFPFTFLVSAYFLWDYFGIYTIVSYGGLYGFVELSNIFNKKTKAPRDAKNAVTDERVKLTNELIECIRLIKMYAWEIPLRTTIEKLRVTEFYWLKQLFKFELLGACISEMSAYLCAYFMFAAYSILSGSYLDPEKVYTSIMILTFVKMWCILFSNYGRLFQVTSGVMQTRIESILSIKDILTKEYSKPAQEMRELRVRDPNAGPSVIFDHFTARWNPQA